MAENNSKDLISNEVLQKATQDILQTVAEHLYDYEPYTNEQIAEIFDLDNVTAKSLSKVINDEYVAKNKVFSNEHTMELLSKTLAEANQYTTEQIANSGKLERKIVTSTSEVINENILYLILTDSTNNIYTQYMLIDGNATPLGTTQINLNDYLKTIDFNTEIDKYAKKNTVVLQNDVVGDLTTLSSNQVLSTQGVSDELDKKVDKTSLVTSIDSSSTDSEVPSALATFNLLKTVYPVGSIYINTTDVNPSTIFGFGTWERVAQNMTLWGSSADGEVGTTKSAGLPNITGRIGYFPGDRVLKGNGMGELGAFDKYNKINSSINNVSISGTADSYYFDFDASLSNSIYGNSNTVQPPALVINIWKRTA